VGGIRLAFGFSGVWPLGLIRLWVSGLLDDSARRRDVVFERHGDKGERGDSPGPALSFSAAFRLSGLFLLVLPGMLAQVHKKETKRCRGTYRLVPPVVRMADLRFSNNLSFFHSSSLSSPSSLLTATSDFFFANFICYSSQPLFRGVYIPRCLQRLVEAIASTYDWFPI